ncbi:hypothetical protein H0H92_000255 [Tricholoma furcatifolium]|nr:hypothetical protein H0H92_000255 [Tricholoma furcatifolium]
MEVLKSIHAVGVRHRDLRIDNLTINRDGDPYIIDFDRAALEADEESHERERNNLKLTLKGYGDPRLSRETFESERATF